MDGHFRAFSFVDRIARIEPGVRISGAYTIPPGIGSFPASLVAEAVGQLAAWASMAAVDFTHRPVAGIAGRIELLSAVRPGQTLELAAELESVDTETVGYSGTAHANDHPVIRLSDCVGPMVPTEDFDEPALLRERFNLLISDGTEIGAFGGIPSLALDRGRSEPGRTMRVTLQVPKTASFFADHFPRRPVFPGTLLMHANLQTALALAAEVPSGNGGGWIPKIVSDVKLRTFIPPGEVLDIEARLTDRSDVSLMVAVESRMNRRLIGSAEVQLTPEVHS